MVMRIIYNLSLSAVIVCLLQSCIKNDIGYPQIALSIIEMQVTGQQGNAVISEDNRTVTLNIEETQDLKKVQVTAFTVTEGAESTLAVNDIIDLTSPYKVTLSLYQNYQWSIFAKRNIDRTYKLQNQVGVSDINEEQRLAVAYVTKDTKWRELQLLELKLGPVGATYNGSTEIPSLNWTVYSNYASAKILVKYKDFFEEEWEVRAYRKDKNAETKQADGWVNVAWLYGEGLEGADNGFEIRETSALEWQKVDKSYITFDGAAFTACVPHLKAETEYICRAYSGTDYGTELSFTTGKAVEIPGGLFEDWSKEDKGNNKILWKPWAEGMEKGYWDTGNKGATTVGTSNTIPVLDTWNGLGKAAQLKSVYIVLKFAAGNLFVGDYLRTDVTDGVLSFGKPFTERPTRLKGHIKYTSVIIDKSTSEFSYLKGRPDSCYIYVALGDWDEPVEIRTKKSERKLFDKNDPNIIAYAEFISGKTIPQYTELDLPLVYRSTSRIPKYLVLVCTASKYGDYFTGGDGSTLWVDDFSLEYDYDD